MTLRWLTPFLALLFIACGGAPSYEWAELKLADLPDKEAHPDTSGVVLLSTVDVRYEADPVSGEPVAVVTRVYRAKLLVERRSVRVSTFENEWNTLEAFDARLIQPPRKADGKPATKKMGMDKTIRGPSVAAVEYSTTEGVQLRLGKARAGSVYEMRTVHRVTAPRLYPHGQIFANEWPIVKASLTVQAPSEWTLAHAAQAMGSPVEWAPTSETSAGMTTLTWTAENVAALPVESRSPSMSMRGKRVKVRLASWKEKGQLVKAPESFKALSAYEATLHAKGTDEADPALAARATDEALKKQVEALLAGVPPDDPRAKAQKLYDWVRQNIRYVSVNLGIGGWVPTSAKETWARLYGDCKDKANLLKAMLAHAGIESRLGTLWSSSNGFRWAYDLPVVAGNANHVILIIDLPSGPVFADPTDRSVAFGTLPFRDQGASILPITADGSDLIKTPESTSAQNYRELALSLDLAADGTVAGEFKLSALGTLADGFRQYLTMVPEGLRGRVVSNTLASPLFTVGELNAIEALEPPDAKTPVIASGLLAATTMTNTTGDMVSLSLADLVARSTPSVSATKDRTSPLLLGARRQLRDRVKVILGDGLSADALPEAVKVEAPFATARLQWTLTDGVLSLDRDVEFKETRLDATKADAYRDFMTRVERASATPVVLQRGGGS